MPITIGQIKAVESTRDFPSTASTGLTLFIAKNTLRYRIADSSGMIFDSLLARPRNITSTSGTVVINVAGTDFTFDTSSVQGTDAGWKIEEYFTKKYSTKQEDALGVVTVETDVHNYIAELLDACYPFNEWEHYTEFYPNKSKFNFSQTEGARLVTELVPFLSGEDKLGMNSPANGKFKNLITGNYEYPVEGNVYVSPNQGGPMPVSRLYFHATDNTGYAWTQYIPSPIYINEVVGHNVQKKVIGETLYRFWATANNGRYWYYTGESGQLRLDMGKQVGEAKGWVDFI